MKFKKFFQNLFKKFFQSLFKILYGNIKFTKNKSYNYRKYKIETISYKNKYHVNEFLYSIPNSRIYTDTVEHVAIIQNNELVHNVSFQQVNSILRDETYNKVLTDGTPRLLKNFEGNILSLVQGASGNNYFHFLFDIVIKIVLANTIIPNNEINHYYLPGKKKWQIDILSELDINQNKIIDSNEYRHLKANNILALEHPWYKKGLIQEGVNNIPEWIVLFLRERFINKAKKFDNCEYIFIDRSDSDFNRCKLVNNNEIIEILEKKGFKSYKVSELSFFEQIYLFKKAKVIIGPHGAAFSNLIFSNKDLKLFEIIPSDHLSLKCKRFSNILGFEYNRFNLERIDEADGDMFLDKKTLTKILSSV